MATGSEQRAVERFSFTDRLRVKAPGWIHGEGVDIGTAGICVLVPQSIAEGTAVEVELFGGTAFVKGTVRKTSPGVRGFKVGIQFSEPQPAVVAKAKGSRK